MFLVEAKPLNANLFDKSKDGGVNQIKGLFRLAEVKEHYDFGVATEGLRWVFIDKNKFLQSKGIIGEDILKYLAEVKEDLLTPKLRQLFFGCLGRPKAERFDIDERFKDVPYLNGSLFVHTEVERKNIDYKVRAEILKNILQFLDSFKFVHKEQLGNGDSVDPEILGYIFERAMTARDRKGTGAYYTPKSITKYISENTIYPCIIEKTYLYSYIKNHEISQD